MNSIIEAQHEYFDIGGGMEIIFSHHGLGLLESFSFPMHPQYAMEKKLLKEYDEIHPDIKRIEAEQRDRIAKRNAQVKLIEKIFLKIPL